MTKKEIWDALLGILSSKEQMSLQIDTSEITDDTSLTDDVALDSIQLLELIVAIEKRFNFTINTEDLNISIFNKFSELVDCVAQNIAMQKENA